MGGFQERTDARRLLGQGDGTSLLERVLQDGCVEVFGLTRLPGQGPGSIGAGPFKPGSRGVVLPRDGVDQGNAELRRAK